MRRFSGLLALTACVETTGGQVVDFPVAAAGAADVVGPLRFTSDLGWDVVLTKATLHIGAVYLDSAAPVSGAQDTPCILPGTYLAEETTGMDVDLLSSMPQRFSALGHGMTGLAIEGQLWLTGVIGDIGQVADVTKILAVEGTATKDGDVHPFAGDITIGSNRATTMICKQRVVSISTDVRIRTEGGLLVRIDARRFFTNVDFSNAFVDAPNQNQASTNLYSNLHAGNSTGTPYSFVWTTNL